MFTFLHIEFFHVRTRILNVEYFARNFLLPCYEHGPAFIGLHMSFGFILFQALKDLFDCTKLTQVFLTVPYQFMDKSTVACLLQKTGPTKTI